MKICCKVLAYMIIMGAGGQVQNLRGSLSTRAERNSWAGPEAAVHSWNFSSSEKPQFHS